MTEEQILNVMADIGPHAKDALDSWVQLLWAKFITTQVVSGILCIALIYGIWKIARYINKL